MSARSGAGPIPLRIHTAARFTFQSEIIWRNGVSVGVIASAPCRALTREHSTSAARVRYRTDRFGQSPLLRSSRRGFWVGINAHLGRCYQSLIAHQSPHLRRAVRPLSTPRLAQRCAPGPLMWRAAGLSRCAR